MGRRLIGLWEGPGDGRSTVPTGAGLATADGVVLRCIGSVLSQDRRQTAVAEDQHLVRGPGPSGEREPFGVGTRADCGAGHHGFDGRAAKPISGQ